MLHRTICARLLGHTTCTTSPWLDFRMPERRICAMQTQKVGSRHNSNMLVHDWLLSFLRENQFRLLLCVGLAPLKSHLLLVIEAITVKLCMSHRIPNACTSSFNAGDGNLLAVENSGSQGRLYGRPLGPRPRSKYFAKMISTTGPTARYHGNTDRAAHKVHELHVKARMAPISINAVHEQLACS